MRQPPRIHTRVDIELPLAPCAGTPGAASMRPRPRLHGGPPARRDRRYARKALACAIAAAAAGCATHDADPARQFRIEPVYSVTHTAQSAASSQAYYTLGKYFDDMHEWDRAVDAYRQAVAADTGNAEALDALGVALAQGRHFDEAEATLRRAVALAPERVRSRNNLGYLLLVQGRPQDAMEQLKVAVSLDAGNAVALANLRNAVAQSERAGGTATATAAPTAPVAAATPTPTPTATATATATAETPSTTSGTATATPTPTPTPTPTAATAEAAEAAAPAPAPTVAQAPDVDTPKALRIARLEVSNGNGVNGMAAQLGLWLAARGVATQRLTNQQPYDQRRTVIQFRSGQDEAARRLASLLPASAQTEARPSPGLASDVRVVLGQDWRSVADCLAHSSCRTASMQVARMDSPANQ